MLSPFDLQPPTPSPAPRPSHPLYDSAASTATQIPAPTQLLFPPISELCDVVKVKWRSNPGELYKHGIWIATDIALGTFVWLEGDLRMGMTCHTVDSYPLIYPSPCYTTEFQGAVERGRLGEVWRLCETTEVPDRQVDAEGRRLVEGEPLFWAEDWVLKVLVFMWDHDLMKSAVEPCKLLGNDPELLRGVRT